jgi:divalent metal cation (Fe/Co/Zn/Cd) transporter
MAAGEESAGDHRQADDCVPRTRPGSPRRPPRCCLDSMTAEALPDRPAVVRRGRRLTWATIAYNSLEAVLALGAGTVAGSIALVGFGFDSVIELSSSLAGLWRLHADKSVAERERAERQALRVIGVCFLLLAVYVLVDAIRTLQTGQRPQESLVGILIAIGSLVVMPLLARAKRKVAAQLTSSALTAEARQTEICWYLSLILLAGLAVNAALGWWWADPVAALAMVPLIAHEGVQAVRGRTVCADDCH